MAAAAGPRDAAPSQRPGNPYSALWFSSARMIIGSRAMMRLLGGTHVLRAARARMISASARPREERTGVLESPPPSPYGDVGSESLSPPVDWNMPNAVSKVVRPSTSTCEMLHETRVSIDRLSQEPMLFEEANVSSLLMKWMELGTSIGH